MAHPAAVVEQRSRPRTAEEDARKADVWRAPLV